MSRCLPRLLPKRDDNSVMTDVLPTGHESGRVIGNASSEGKR
jgi:hypothetical protein